MFRALLFSFLLITSLLPAVAQPTSDIVSRYATLDHGMKKYWVMGPKLRFRKTETAQYRVKVAQNLNGDRFWIIGTDDLAAFSSSLKRRRDAWVFQAQLSNGNTQEVILRKQDAYSQLLSQLELHIRNRLPSKYQGASLQEQDAFVQSQLKKYQSALKGKRSLPFDATWYLNLGPASELAYDSYSVQIWRRNKAHGQIFCDTLKARFAETLPAIEEEDCTTVYRNTFFNQFTQELLKTLPYQSYTAPTRARTRRTFQLFFEQNKVEYLQEKVDTILTFLADSSYQVAKAHVRGMASVEGDSAINMRLMEARAEVLLKTLQKAQEDSIALETETYENWDLFFYQLHRMGRDSAEYSRQEWKDLLKQDSVAEALEPWLAEQRRADLILYLYRTLDSEERLQRSFYDYRMLYRNMRRQNSFEQSLNIVRNLVGIRLYLEDQMQAGKITKEELENVAPISAVDYLLKVYYAEVLIRRRQQGFRVPDDFQSRVVSAHQAALVQMGTNLRPEVRFYSAHTVALQGYIFQGILDGTFDADWLCELKYPESGKYFPLILNYYSFLQRSGAQYLGSLPCNLTSSNSTILPPIDGHSYDNDTVSITSLDARHSRYYYFLKQWVLNKDQEILGYVTRVGEYYMFDLMELVEINVKGWDVVEQVYWDSDIPFEKLAELVAELNTYRSQICATSIYPLLLEYHRKLQLHFLNWPPKNREQQRQLSESLDFVAKYYSGKLKVMSPEQAQMVAEHLVAMNSIHLGNGLVRDAYEIMDGVRNDSLLADSDWGREFANLLVMGAPNLRLTIPKIQREATEETQLRWQQGPYQVQPDLWQHFMLPPEEEN